MLDSFLGIKLDDVDTENVWFYQHGPTTDAAGRSPGLANGMFPGRLIDVRILKKKVFQCQASSLEELKARMRYEIDAIKPQLTRRVVNSR
ncbi:hypothetical protein Trydic_g22105 [Trypoxylus dichotomus]